MCVHVHVHCDLLVQFVLHVTHHHTLRRGCHAIELHRRSKRNLGFARSVKHLVKPHRILLTSIESPNVSLAKPGELFRKANAEGKYSLAKTGGPYWLCRWISMTARHTQYRGNVPRARPATQKGMASLGRPSSTGNTCG